MTHAPARTLARRAAGLGTTVFSDLTELAVRTGAINLGQGSPEADGPPAVLEAARRALFNGANQYPPLNGTPALRRALAQQRLRRYGVPCDEDTGIVVTTGATEAVTAAVLGLCDPGDEIIVFDPAYDVYTAAARLAGAGCRRVPLLPGGDGFRYDPDALRAAVTRSTRLLLLNTPHNPTGKVFTRGELADIAAVCQEYDLVAVVDEVYEYLVYGDRYHLPLTAVDGMADRTLCVSSAGKTLNLTGWKVGWACGPAHLVDAVRAVKQYTTFASAAPLQDAVAWGLTHQDAWVAAQRSALAANRDALSAGLRTAGLAVLPAEGGYFLQADAARAGHADASEYCRRLAHECGVVAIPTRVFAEDPSPYASLVRFAFCKSPRTISQAVGRLARSGSARPRG
ncbi:aminotransferase class I/II-fold pyridoxal phosphate-dependent enzyme [Streptomyces sp. NPDC052020]|uniref:aminotransferase class I/II-fold pyridoxal phosphate-dependent enzyme n=1 Tax=Streptomyces sp. NPDC052020 TaxID=3155677 RepID=UPI00343B616B